MSYITFLLLLLDGHLLVVQLFLNYSKKKELTRVGHLEFLDKKNSHITYVYAIMTRFLSCLVVKQQETIIQVVINLYVLLKHLKRLLKIKYLKIGLKNVNIKHRKNNIIIVFYIIIERRYIIVIIIIINAIYHNSIFILYLLNTWLAVFG